ncbi:hypothetical protein G4B88_015249 [Cannabis sativa]|uniref:SIS domain-containing protein n=1 Tax=Cannabis sativa TaxID=3483 RepID=A0A7J6HBB8_CANSA|nr:hypothetical protein G4B88_015249 [Cannabis sativa]
MFCKLASRVQTLTPFFQNSATPPISPIEVCDNCPRLAKGPTVPRKRINIGTLGAWLGPPHRPLVNPPHATKLIKAFIGVPSGFLSPVDAIHGDIWIVSKRDVLVLFSKSGNTDELLRLVPCAKAKGAYLISVTSVEGNALAGMIFGDIVAIALMGARNLTREEYACNHPPGRIGKSLIFKNENIPQHFKLRFTKTILCKIKLGIRAVKARRHGRSKCNSSSVARRQSDDPRGCTVQQHPEPAVLSETGQEQLSPWKTMVFTIIRGHRLEGFINGQKPCPEQFITTGIPNSSDSQVSVNPEYENWLVHDQLLMRWLCGSMTEGIASEVMGGWRDYELV